MSQAKCGHCGAVGRFELEEVQVGSVSNTFNVHLIGWTLFKCAACGAVLGVVDGAMARVAERQGFKR